MLGPSWRDACASAVHAACSAPVSRSDLVGLQVDLVAAVHNPVEDGVGQCRIVQVGVTGLDRQLASDQGRSRADAVVQQLQQIGCRPGFFLPVRVLSRLFRRLFLALLRDAFDRQELRFFNALAALQDTHAFASYLAPVARAEWVVYAKPPFGGPERVLEYLGRYTHRVAISNSRLVDFADGQVAFQWKDYRHESQHKVMRVAAQEFVRRFLLHVLPTGFQRIRHYGLLANRYREAKLARCRQLLQAPAPTLSEEPTDYQDRYQRLTGVSLRDCPECAHGQMVCIESFLPGAQPRGPPRTAS